METLKNLYFAPSIKAFKQKRIKNQLEKNNPKLPSDMHPIIMRKDGDNLFQFITLEEYYRLADLSDSYYVIGAVSKEDEFLEFVQYFFNMLMAKSVDINKEDILDYLMNGDRIYD